MNELQSIIEASRRLEGLNRKVVLATVVHVTGSAYRRPGARMLILPDGTRVGTISGGCLEGDVARKAWWFTGGGRPSLRVYDTSSDEDAVWEFGLGCNGVIHVLLERLDAGETEFALEFLDSCRRAQRSGVMATVIRASEVEDDVQIGDRLCLSYDGILSGRLAHSRLGRALEQHMDQVRTERQSRLVHLEHASVFVEWISAPMPLVIFGAGHDAIPVATLAKSMGWHVTVVDGRPAYATRARFPDVERVVVMDAGEPLAGITIGRETAVVLMTHSYPLEARLLREILPARPRYLGVLGPAKRMDRLYAELGVHPDSFDVHAPIGLDIGTDTPQAIAVSIVAEIQAETSGRSGMKLRYRCGPIHLPVNEAGVEGDLSELPVEMPACELHR